MFPLRILHNGEFILLDTLFHANYFAHIFYSCHHRSSRATDAQRRDLGMKITTGTLLCSHANNFSDSYVCFKNILVCILVTVDRALY